MTRNISLRLKPVTVERFFSQGFVHEEKPCENRRHEEGELVTKKKFFHADTTQAITAATRKEKRKARTLRTTAIFVPKYDLSPGR
jgi:hypothetical protein